MRNENIRFMTFEQAGASFENRYGVKTPASLSSSAEEYAMVRDAAALSDASTCRCSACRKHRQLTLDPLLAGNVARTRFGRMLHTFLADDNGFVVADCYVANNDDEFILLCESIEDDMAIRDFYESLQECRH